MKYPTTILELARLARVDGEGKMRTQHAAMSRERSVPVLAEKRFILIQNPGAITR